MSSRTQRRMPVAPPELDEEQEVDLNRYWSALVARWWLAVVGLVVGVVIGALAWVGSGSGGFRSQAIIYLGQPLFPGTTTPTFPVGTNFKFVDQLIHSNAVLRQAAARVHVKPSALDDD